MRNQRATGRDMIISLAVILLPAMAIYYFFSRTPAEPEVPVADWKPVVADARTEAPYDILAPSNLPETWKPVRARYGNDELQLGFLSPDKVYFEVKQRVGANQPGFISTVTREGRQDGTSEVATAAGVKRTWKRYLTGDERSHCLVSAVEGKRPSTTIVCGDVPYEGVEAFSSTLA
ncbi:DUF4245 domain-containing protein [Luteococcus japonicus]|uniref:Putative secreted protein n=1 Tax=Luteococcus japonicus LSP_Lj1 TaxID=1255658 RepID=A0A1R4KF97_9ACTN|nr:DUF4245 domain-containing protein [Luteococcus japonicus]SJN42653.1 putative secreted protein [Luteococcus japonicus LSP_Lj1]